MMPLCRALFALALLLLAPAAAAAATGCAGRNLLADLPPETRARLDAAVQATPFARGNLWRATRDGQMVTLLGTYHLDDPRHDAIEQAIAPALQDATALLVEAGPQEERALMAQMAKDPQTILSPDGVSLREALTDAEWAELSAAMQARGMPAFMAARLRPWYVTMLLSVPPCALQAARARNGLDQRLMNLAEAGGLPIRGLEPFDTALKVFDAMPMPAQMALVRSTLALEDQAEDQMATLSAIYFAEDSRLMWEYQKHISLALPGATPASVEAEFAAMEEALMIRRNRAWIPVLTAAAADGPVVAAFGALHLSGPEGVLALMQAEGWDLERLPFPGG
jgi:uncharacterized protein YbaP (TraB family)